MTNTAHLRDIVHALKTERWSAALAHLGHRDPEAIIKTHGKEGALDIVLHAIPALIESEQSEAAVDVLRQVLPHRPRDAARLAASHFVKSGTFKDLIPLFEVVKSLVDLADMQELVTRTARDLVASGQRSKADELLHHFGCAISVQDMRVWEAYARADALAKAGRLAESDAQLRNVIVYADDEALAAIHQMLGENALRAHRFADAKAVYEETLVTFADRHHAKEVVTGAKLGLAEALYGMGDLAASVRLLKDVVHDVDAPAWAVNCSARWLRAIDECRGRNDDE